jgi:hypothetical protein
MYNDINISPLVTRTAKRKIGIGYLCFLRHYMITKSIRFERNKLIDEIIKEHCSRCMVVLNFGKQILR